MLTRKCKTKLCFVLFGKLNIYYIVFIPLVRYRKSVQHLSTVPSFPSNDSQTHGYQITVTALKLQTFTSNEFIRQFFLIHHEQHGHVLPQCDGQLSTISNDRLNALSHLNHSHSGIDVQLIIKSMHASASYLQALLHEKL